MAPLEVGPEFVLIRRWGEGETQLSPRWMIGQENLFALALSKSLHPRTIIRNGRRADPMNLLSHTQKFKLAPTFCVFSIPEVEKVLFTSQCNAQRYQKTKIQNLVFYQRSSLFCTLIVFRSSII